MTPAKGQTWVTNGYVYPQGATHVVDVVDGKVEFSPEGGGFVYRAPIEKFLDSFTYRPSDASEPAWVESRFALDDTPSWPGFWQGYRWNGWATPSFERATLLDILEAIEAEFTEKDGVFVLDDDVNDPMEIEPFTAVINGVERTLYSFDGWCFFEDRD